MVRHIASDVIEPSIGRDEARVIKTFESDPWTSRLPMEASLVGEYLTRGGAREVKWAQAGFVDETAAMQAIGGIVVEARYADFPDLADVQRAEAQTDLDASGRV